MWPRLKRKHAAQTRFSNYLACLPNRNQSGANFSSDLICSNKSELGLCSLKDTAELMLFCSVINFFTWVTNNQILFDGDLASGSISQCFRANIQITDNWMPVINYCPMTRDDFSNWTVSEVSSKKLNHHRTITSQRTVFCLFCSPYGPLTANQTSLKNSRVRQSQQTHSATRAGLHKLLEINGFQSALMPMSHSVWTTVHMFPFWFMVLNPTCSHSEEISEPC